MYPDVGLVGGVYRKGPYLNQMDCWGLIYYLGSNLREDRGLGLEGGVLAQSRLSGSSQLSLSLNVLEVLGRSLSSLGRQLLNQLLALPADLGGQIAEHAELSLGLQTQSLDGLGDRHLLLSVIGSGHAVEDLEALQSGLTSGGLVGEHSSNSSPEHHRGGGVVKRASSGIGSGGLVLEFLVLELVSEQRSGDIDTLASHNSDLLTVQDLLGNDRSQATEEVTLTVDDQFLLKHRKGN